MNTFNNLPLVIPDLDEATDQPSGLDYVAFVDRPAIKRGFLAFRDHTPKPMAFTITSEDRHIVSGPLMLADTPIYRKDEDGEYYVLFTAPVIEKTAIKFLSQGKQGSVNEMHDLGKIISGVVMFESFISDVSRGISPMRGYEDAPEGSWFVSFKVDNEDVWKRVKSGDFTGFSIEGNFYQPPVEPQPADMLAEFSDTEQEQLAILSEAFKFFV